MQYVGNSEVHLDDLCANDSVLKERIDHILQNRVYPLVRQAFAEDNQGGESPAGPLCVYDSIFVRYNGDEAVMAGRVGASQPLHQDGGIYSVNIALNSHKDDDANGFSGGGTFLEGLSRDNISCIQRPISPGHALLHHTTARHAGVSYFCSILSYFMLIAHVSFVIVGRLPPQAEFETSSSFFLPPDILKILSRSPRIRIEWKDQ
jgi:hypothetical protein